MRKDNQNRKGVGGIYSTYEIRGLNLDRLINLVKKRGLTLYDLKKTSNKRLIVTLSLKEGEKFFAIAKELCYNIKKVREKGAMYPLYKLQKRLGLILGGLIFIFFAYYFDGVVFAISYSGSGSLYKREVEEYLTSQGVSKYSRFCDFDIERLEDGILAVNPHLSFASCKKVGSTLKIELALSQEKVEKLDNSVTALYSDADGVIENLKVYRGTAVVGVGDSVNSGDLIVSGEMLIKEQTVKTNVLAVATIICEKTFIYRSGSSGEEERALLLAEVEYFDITPIDEIVTVDNVGDEYFYTVKLKFRRILKAG